MPLVIYLFAFIAVLLAFSLVHPVLVWHIVVYVFCAVVFNGILFILHLMNMLDVEGSGGKPTKTQVFFVYAAGAAFFVGNIWWIWFVFF